VSPWIPLLVSLSACDPAPADGPSPGLHDPLPVTDQLLRISMALRGVRPEVEELDRVQDDPDALEELVDDYLASPEFGLMVRDLYAEALLLRGVYPVLPAIDALDGYTRGEIARTLWEAPLRLIEDVVLTDQPFTSILTADYTMATGLMERALQVSRRTADLPHNVWGRADWLDHRPAAGLLASSGLWLQHLSAGSNNHRGRANHLARALLCTDFLDRDVTISGSVDLADLAQVAQAVSSDPACVSCHQSLDPLAAYLWGFRPTDMFHIANRAYQRDDDGELVIEDETGEPFCMPSDTLLAEGLDPEGDCFPLIHYVVGFERRWDLNGLRPPGYFGLEHGEELRLDDLGRAIADDPRFSLCTAQRMAGYLGQIPAGDVPFEIAAELQTGFIDSGYDLKALARQVVLSEPFLTRTPASEDDFVYGLQTLRPEQAARVFAQLTGFVWQAEPDPADCGETCWGTVDMVTSGGYGLRPMLGGTDADTKARPSLTPTPIQTLALGRLAAEAAAEVVRHDFARSQPADRLLLREMNPTDTDEGSVRRQLVELHLRVLGERVDVGSDVVDEELALYQDALGTPADPALAWELVLTVLLQDARMVFY